MDLQQPSRWRGTGTVRTGRSHGTPSWKVDEFSRIASEYRQLEKYGFPRLTHPQVAIAYSFDSAIDSHPNGPSNSTLQ
jgi:beta-galactosidase